MNSSLIIKRKLQKEGAEEGDQERERERGSDDVAYTSLDRGSEGKKHTET
jgi:hypothetical protein